ncbi:MAG: hypothetical protein NTZ35_03480 [Ignavibacteriales bacterium]|nr:hypothetical protein [Ignavibacteriales bacterium]
MTEPTTHTDERTSSLRNEYEDLLAKAEQQQPGISELLAVYGDLQKGLEQSQAYLRMFETTYTSSTTSSTR